MIVEKPVLVFGMTLTTVVIIAMILVSSTMAAVISNVDDEKAKKMTLVQGTITMLCLMVYATFISKYERSKK